MDEPPYFFKLLKCSPLLSKAIVDKKLDDTDLHDFDYVRGDKNVVTIKDFVLGEHDRFKEVYILMSDFGILIDFITHDTKYFDNAEMYFNTHSVARSKRGYFIGKKSILVKAKQINKVQIFSKMMNGAVMVSESFGCKIMTGFYPDTEECIKPIRKHTINH